MNVLYYRKQNSLHTHAEQLRETAKNNANNPQLDFTSIGNDACLKDPMCHATRRIMYTSPFLIIEIEKCQAVPVYGLVLVGYRYCPQNFPSSLMIGNMKSSHQSIFCLRSQSRTMRKHKRKAGVPAGWWAGCSFGKCIRRTTEERGNNQVNHCSLTDTGGPGGAVHKMIDNKWE